MATALMIGLAKQRGVAPVAERTDEAIDLAAVDLEAIEPTLPGRQKASRKQSRKRCAIERCHRWGDRQVLEELGRDFASKRYFFELCTRSWRKPTTDSASHYGAIAGLIYAEDYEIVTGHEAPFSRFVRVEKLAVPTKAGVVED